jgi:ribonuclease BN (tRNA processing enzyme)
VRLTILGSGTAQPQPDGPASGLLVQTATTSVLLDCGTGIVTRLEAQIDPTKLDALVIGHLHGDHFLDIVPLRYLFPWAGGTPKPLPVHLPPGGRPRIDALARAISEREGFFDDAFELREFDPDEELRIGDLAIRFRRARHYVPAWSMSITGPDGERLAYLGDTGPSDALVEFARGADVVVLEATLRSGADDDVERGHLAADEAVELATRAGAGRAFLVHYHTARRAEIARICAELGGLAAPAIPGMTLDVVAADRRDGSIATGAVSNAAHPG